MKLRADSIPLRVITLAIVLAMECGVPLTLGGEAATSEYDVKAAFLFHFAQFVEWPSDAFQDVNSPLRYCTIGEDSFRGALDDTLKGKSVAKHPLVVQHLTGKEQIAGCQILFIGVSEKKRLEEELTSTNGHPVLSVGETEHFTNDGGVIGFFMENNKVRFNINLEAAERAKLKISSRLLLLAKNVIGNHE